MNEKTREATEWMAVDRLLRCRRTQRYFSTDGWTHDLSQARTYPSQIEAVRACIQHELTDVELVLRAPGSGADLFATAVR